MAIDVTLVLLALVVMELTDIIKSAIGQDNKEFVPLVAILLGIGFVFSFQSFQGLTTNVVTGIVIGITATGGFENIEKIKEVIERLKKLI